MGATKDSRHLLHTLIVAAVDGNGVDALDIHRFRTAAFSAAPTHLVISTDGFLADHEIFYYRF